MLGVRKGQMLLFRRRKEEEDCWGTKGYKYPQIWNSNGYFRKPGTSGRDPGTSGKGRTSAAVREQLRIFGKNSEVPGKECTRLRQLADRSYVVGMILVLEKIFKHLVSSMPLLVSLLIVRLVLYSNSK